MSTVDGFRDALAVGIVAIERYSSGLAHPRGLAAVLLRKRPRAVAEKIADLSAVGLWPADAVNQIAPACNRRSHREWCAPLTHAEVGL